MSAAAIAARATLLAAAERRSHVLAGHARDVGDRNLLRTDRFAFAFVAAAAEAVRVRLIDHRDHTARPLGIALRQDREVRDLRAHEEMRRRVLAGGHARAAAD